MGKDNWLFFVIIFGLIFLMGMRYGQKVTISNIAELIEINDDYISILKEKIERLEAPRANREVCDE